MGTTTDQNTDRLRTYLDAYAHIREDESIQALIEQQLDVLVTLFQLPQQEANSRILDFTQHYIACCPDYLYAYQALAEKGGVAEYTQAFLDTATEFFFDKHPVVDSTCGSHTVLCKAYLFHRMLEELNDRIELERQWALSPVDMVQTNLIAHTLIGDDQANLLDQTVLIHLETINAERPEKIQRIFTQDTVKSKTTKLKKQGWQNIYTRWPFLKEDISEIFYR